MWRRIIAIGACAVLALTFLAACSGEAGEGSNDASETPASEEDDTGAARTDEGDDVQGQTAGEPEEGEGPELIGETVDVTLTDYEIEMPNTVNSGVVVFGMMNEGEQPHGIAVEATSGTGNDDVNETPVSDGTILGMMVVDPGQDQQLELELDEGDYIVFCPVDDHRDAHGMEFELTVE